MVIKKYKFIIYEFIVPKITDNDWTFTEMENSFLLSKYSFLEIIN